MDLSQSRCSVIILVVTGYEADLIESGNDCNGTKDIANLAIQAVNVRVEEISTSWHILHWRS
jgi:hypothetical protein